MSVNTKVVKNIGGQMGRTSRLWRAVFDEAVAPLGLTQPRWMALMHLSVFKHGCTQKELANSLMIKLPSLMRTLNYLEDDELIKLTPSCSDKRAKDVVLTAKGEVLISELQDKMNRIQKILLSGISEEGIKMLEALIAKINNNASQYLKKTD